MRKRMIAIWAAAALSQLALLGVAYLTRAELFSPDISAPALGTGDSRVVPFFILGVCLVVLSFAFRRRFAERTDDADSMLKGLIIALALCETCAFLGFALAFAFDYQYFYIWIVMGFGATLLHFPRDPKPATS